ncbi:hypothetical protein A1Q1_04282 [Trichosporon asahii var. asahii CBS 2479]|uniref:Uncharacterized protein n=1 Tax=Trichosporon asahii var. asahii (strain ATCC 90039 / CBS 2479 / JCM 2466 / KCTC 7840 / NBRC 103889/ NCYC 2677 / UAMH 7654) TaxID=1186058 RepID=J6ERC7_TRIAS|nr:hypothetical protein A1Q1_04282 [Trichosporon asahii var. asahii CBS 2479]EJT47039.1 hypothetical protein A1Q1_04282 [Trichosporon asahii var. asahii CBS 2479]
MWGCGEGVVEVSGLESGVRGRHQGSWPGASELSVISFPIALALPAFLRRRNMAEDWTPPWKRDDGVQDPHEVEVSALEDALTVPRPESASTLTAQSAGEYDMDIDDELPTTYSSLPPSPRASEYSRRLDISELQSAFNRADPSPRRPFASLSDGESDTQEFWPARSRRQTLDYANRPSLDTLQKPRRHTLSRTSSNTTRQELTKETTRLKPEPEVDEPASPVEDSTPPNRVKETKPGLSLWDLLRDEDAAEQWEGWIADGKWERIANFLAVPLVVEKDTIKLYVIFNALEIGDRLCCAFGQDVIDTLFARDTLTYTDKRRKRDHVRPVFFFTLSLAYVFVHTLIFFYMLISLNVAINSYDYTLISLLISNQFVEIKGYIVERFQLGLMLVVISLRNMIEMAGSDLAFLPRSFVRGKSLLERILSHAFIAKFNHVRATVYGRFTDILAKDVLLAGTYKTEGRNKKKSPLVSRRLGIANIPLAVLVVRIGAQIFGMLTSSGHAVDGEALSSGLFWTALKWVIGILVTATAWGCLVVVKLLLGLGLLSYSALRQAGMEEREAEDEMNNFGRDPVGVSKEEMAYHKEVSQYLSQPADDLPDHPSAPISAADPATPRPTHTALPKPQGKKKNWKLEDVERWTMVKRIW